MWTVDKVRESEGFDTAVRYMCVCGLEIVVPMSSAHEDYYTESTCTNCHFRFVLSVPYSDNDKREKYQAKLSREVKGAMARGGINAR